MPRNDKFQKPGMAKPRPPRPNMRVNKQAMVAGLSTTQTTPSLSKPAFNKGTANEDKLLRSMPITEKQLGQIKRHYGIK